MDENSLENNIDVKKIGPSIKDSLKPNWYNVILSTITDLVFAPVMYSSNAPLKYKIAGHLFTKVVGYVGGSLLYQDSRTVLNINGENSGNVIVGNPTP